MREVKEVGKWSWLRLAIVLLGLVLGGWMVGDGVRALTVGDYFTPREGPHAGQLGPWAALFRGLDIEPRSTPVKVCFVVLGSAWLVATLGCAAGRPRARSGVAVLAVLTLWYLPVGTLIALGEIFLLWKWRPDRRAPGGEAADQER